MFLSLDRTENSKRGGTQRGFPTLPQITIFETISKRAQIHPLIEMIQDDRTGRVLMLVYVTFDPDLYPNRVPADRLEILSYSNEITFSATRRHIAFGGERQCRWDRHPKPHTSRTQFISTTCPVKSTSQTSQLTTAIDGVETNRHSRNGIEIQQQKPEKVRLFAAFGIWHERFESTFRIAPPEGKFH